MAVTGPLKMNIVTLSYHSTNYYAIDLDERKLLIDCGWPGTLTQFTAEMKRKGIVPADIRYILVTHFHPDHAGLVQEFKDQGSKLILMESQVRFVTSVKGHLRTKKDAFTEIRPDDNFILSFRESRKFLASLGLAGEVLETPGHSPDSITLVLDEGSAFIGDLPPRFLIPDDDKLKQESWERISQHHITRIFPAHGS